MAGLIKCYNWFKNYSYTKKLLVSKKMNFQSTQGFSSAKLEYSGRKMNYAFELIPKFYFGTAQQLKSEVKKKIPDAEWTRIFKRLEVSQRQIYKGKIKHPVGYYIDLKNAYTNILRILGFVPDEVYKKLINYKLRGHNINRILGLAYLGNKAIEIYDGGNLIEERREGNVYTGVFYLAKYLVHKLMIGLYYHPLFNNILYARFIDCVIVQDCEYSIDAILDIMRRAMVEIFFKELYFLNEYTYRYAGFPFNDAIKFNISDDFYQYLQFNVYNVNNISYSESGGLRMLTFFVHKDGNVLKKIYKSGALTDNAQERYSFTSAAIFKEKKKKADKDVIPHIDIYEILEKMGYNYTIFDKENNFIYSKKSHIFLQKYDEFIEQNQTNYLKSLEYEVEDINITAEELGF